MGSMACGGELRFRTDADQPGFISDKVFYPRSDSQGLTVPIHKAFRALAA